MQAKPLEAPQAFKQQARKDKGAEGKVCPPPASAFSELKSSPEQRWVALPAHCAPLSAAQGAR